MRVLVTGGAGYLGSVLCEVLLRVGHHVTVVDSLIFGQHSLFHLCANPAFDFVCGDVRNEGVLKEALKAVDAIVPLAAPVGAPLCEREPEAAKAVNLDSIRALNRLRSRDQLVVFPTTNSGYGTKTGDVYCTEDTLLEPISLYGKTKVDAESELLSGENTITLRLATVFGMSSRMRLDLLVNHFVHAAIKERCLVLFEKDFKRNYIHIRDVADCFVHCLEHSDAMAGRPYNAGLDDANYSKEQLALKIKEHLPWLYIHSAEIGSDPDKRNYVVSNARLREAGFSAKRGVDEGIRELVTGYKMMGRPGFGNA